MQSCTHSRRPADSLNALCRIGAYARFATVRRKPARCTYLQVSMVHSNCLFTHGDRESGTLFDFYLTVAVSCVFGALHFTAIRPQLARLGHQGYCEGILVYHWTDASFQTFICFSRRSLIFVSRPSPLGTYAGTEGRTLSTGREEIVAVIPSRSLSNSFL